MADEWVKNARNKARVETKLRAETSKALKGAEQKNQELTTKLTMEERVQKSAKVGLKNVQDQAEDQRKKLYHTEIELATAKQQVLKLKAKLQRAKDVTLMTEEAAEASKQASYDLGVQETEVCLADGLAEVCRDYCQEVWMEALNLVEVPATSEQRKAKNIFYPADIREVPTALPPPTTLTPTFSEQPSTTQGPLPLIEVPKGLGKAGDQGQEADVAKDKGKGKGGQR